MIEQLTAEERAQMTTPSISEKMSKVRRKALRIIDAHAADRAALVAIIAECERGMLGASPFRAKMKAAIDGYVPGIECPGCGYSGKLWEHKCPARADRTALVAQLEAAERDAVANAKTADNYMQEMLDAQRREDVRVREVQTHYEAEVTRLTRELTESRQMVAVATLHRDEALKLLATRVDASRLDEANGEVARLTEALAAAEREPQIAGYTWCKLERAEAAESRLAAANKLLERWMRNGGDTRSSVVADTRAHLAAHARRGMSS